MDLRIEVSPKFQGYEQVGAGGRVVCVVGCLCALRIESRHRMEVSGFGGRNPSGVLIGVQECI